MTEETANKIFLIAAAIGAVLLGASVLVAAINLGGAIVSGVMVVIFQIIVTGAGIVLLLGIAGALFSAMYSGVVKRISAIELMHGEILKKINKRTPTFVTSTALIATLVLLLADTAFDGQPIPTICVGVVLALLFWIANELLVAETRAQNVLGCVAWGAALIFLPAAIYIHHAGNVGAILQDLYRMGVTTTSLIGLAFLVACFAPVALKGNG